MDLIALGDVLLLPEDDLSLAAVLRSPLFGLSEEALFELAYDRGEATLYERLQAARDRPPFAAAYARLRELQAQVDFLPPFEFYVRLLGEGGGRRRLLARLGPAAAEPIEAFLAQALAFEQSHPPSMQAFLHWLRADTTELIRDPDRPRDEVRVLTCHGAKGLEAPIVFIADATFVPTSGTGCCGPRRAAAVAGRQPAPGPVERAADRRAALAQQQEQRRLLYVALTRAQERLIVAGWQRKNQAAPTWYDWITAGMARLGAARCLDAARATSSATAPARVRPGAAATGSAAARRCPRRRLAAPGGRGGAGAGAAARPSRMAEEEDPGAPSPLLATAAERAPAGASSTASCRPPGRPPEQWAPLLARLLADPALALGPEEQRALADEIRRSSKCRNSPRSARTRAPRCRSPAWSAVRRCSARSIVSRSARPRC